MRLSTKGRYATRAMFDLAMRFGDGPVQVKDIAKNQEISERYLEQLLLPLKVAGLLRATRGASGGFELTKRPSEIRLIDIFHIAEGSTAPVDCVDDASLCQRSANCVTREVWVRMKAATDEVLESTTLQDLIDRQAEGVFIGDGI